MQIKLGVDSPFPVIKMFLFLVQGGHLYHRKFYALNQVENKKSESPSYICFFSIAFSSINMLKWDVLECSDLLHYILEKWVNYINRLLTEEKTKRANKHKIMLNLSSTQGNENLNNKIDYFDHIGKFRKCGMLARVWVSG